MTASSIALLILAASASSDEGIEFFEAKIRPVLIEHCYECHSAESIAKKKWRGGLRLDSKAGLLRGGDSGPAIDVKSPSESLLIASLRYDGDYNMPPKGKLPDHTIADFERWLRLGAPDPRKEEPTGRQTGMSLNDGRNFWAYRLPVDHKPPTLPDSFQAGSTIDRFIAAKWVEKGINAPSLADRMTLIRRLYFDLAGLPPSEQEIRDFVSSSDPLAYEKLVDRLLAAPTFGERWGRHWLDIARFGESLTLRGFVLPEAWRYRDYVIDAFNTDLPFDQFAVEQIAGDLMASSSLEARRRQFVATTYLMLGNTNLEEQDKKQLDMDVIDEQIDTIGKGFLAQTIGCARCHDHKFDPIPTSDYYALAGVFQNVQPLKHANVSEWMERPIPMEPTEEKKAAEFESRIAALEAKLKKATAKTAGKKAPGPLAVSAIAGFVVDDADAEHVGNWTRSTFHKTYIGEGYCHDDNADKGKKTLTFQYKNLPAGTYEVRLAYAPGGNRATNVPVTVFSADGEKEIRVDMSRPPTIDDRWISLGEHRFEKSGFSHVIVSNENTKGHVIADAVQFLPLNQATAKKSTRNAKSKPTESKEVADLKRELQALRKQAPTRDKAMVVQERKEITDLRIHIRGSHKNLGAVVPRGVLSVTLQDSPPEMPSNASGRLEVANWIASTQNPLTARVWVNRCWHWLFGAGLVRTTDNFGTTGEMPSHPELLDHLAISFMRNGWSTKKLIRELVLSRAYRQSSQIPTGARSNEVDPENRLLSHANRRALDAECFRDAMIVVSGELDRSRAGKSYDAKQKADYGFTTDSLRRTVYLPAFRNAPPELARLFDGADPTGVVGVRDASAVAPQALYLMNSQFVHERAASAARQHLQAKARDKDLIDSAWIKTLGRKPTEKEKESVQTFLAARRGEPIEAWQIVFQSLFSSADFRFLD